MCIVVDANSAHHMRSGDPGGAAVLRWLLRGPGKLVVSSQVLRELAQTKFREVILTLDRAGKVCRANDVSCDADRDTINASGQLCSNDSHVIALVRTSRCDLVFTHDQPLHHDLKNRALVPNGCSIYQGAQHNHLLGQCRC